MPLRISSSVTLLCGYEPKVIKSPTEHSSIVFALAFAVNLKAPIGAMPISITTIKSVERILFTVLFIAFPPVFGVIFQHKVHRFRAPFYENILLL